MVGADTVQRPGGDAAVVRVHGTDKALAMTTDCTPRYCEADPHEGGKQAVAEAYRNLCAVGAKPLAITDCLNFGAPTNPRTMGQLVGCIEGMAEACRALDVPVVSGNVSLYNETEGVSIPPTPSVGAVGLLEDWRQAMTIGLRSEGNAQLFVLGGRNSAALGQSLYAREIANRIDGAPPAVDLTHERLVGEYVRRLIARGDVIAVHDISDGGLLVAITEMALAGDCGAWLWGIASSAGTAWAFGEDQGRYVVVVPDIGPFNPKAIFADCPVELTHIGDVGGDSITIGVHDALVSIPLADLRAAHEGFFPALMAR